MEECCSSAICHRFPLRGEVEQANAARLSNLPGPSQTYLAFDVPGRDHRGLQVTPQQAEKLLERLVAVKSIRLKVGDGRSL